MHSNGWGVSLAALAALCAWVAVSIISRGSWFQIGATALLCVLVGVFLTVLLARRSTNSHSMSRSHIDLLVICWVAVSLLPAHNFTGQSAASAVKSVAVSSAIELAYFSGAAVIALRIIRERTPSLGSTVVPLRFFLLPVWVIASGFWANQAPYAMIRGTQFFMLGILGWATVAAVTGNPAARDDLLGRFMRYVTLAIAALAAYGFLFPAARVQVAAENEDRFTWIGAGPNVAGPLLVTALLIIVIAGDRIRLPLLVRVPVGLLLVAAIFQNQSRASLLGLAGAGVIVLVRAIRDAPRVVAVAVPYAVTAVYLLAVFHWDSIWEYLSRNQSGERLAAGNGRIELWKFGIGSLDGPFDWMAGHGYGITRTLFQPIASWAGTAHNSIIALLVGLGLVGVVLLLGIYASWIWDFLRSPQLRKSPLVLALVAVVLAGFVAAMFTDRIAEPSDGYAVLILLSAVVYAGAEHATEAPSRPDREGAERVGASASS